MAQQESLEMTPAPASGPLLRRAIEVTLDRLRAWCRAEGIVWERPANEDARLWRDLLTFTLERMEGEAAPVFPLRVLTAESGIKLPKRTWEKHEKWFDRNMRAVLRNALAIHGLPMIYPARASSGVRGHSTKSQAAYFLSFEDFAVAPVVESDNTGSCTADGSISTFGESDIGGPTNGSWERDARAAQSGDVSAGGEAIPAPGGGLVVPTSKAEADTGEKVPRPETPATAVAPLHWFPIGSTIVTLSSVVSSAWSGALPVVAVLALSMTLLQIRNEVWTAAASAEGIFVAIKDALAGNVLPRFF